MLRALVLWCVALPLAAQGPLPNEYSSSPPSPYDEETYWDVFWQFNEETYLAVTMCWGTYEWITSYNPKLTEEEKVPARLHEAKHQEQILRLTCPIFQLIYMGAVGQAWIEGEAGWASGMRGERLVDQVMVYERARTLGRNAVRELLKEHGFY